MAGPLPKPPDQRRRRNASPVSGAALPAGGPAGETPDLPGWEEYGTRTLTWYDTWRRSPQAAAFVATDWQRLHMLAPLVDSYFEKPSKDVLTEIRLTEAALGATAADRIRMQWTVVDEEAGAGQPAGPPRIDDARRARALKAVKDGEAG